jgi:hypothetical protein
MIRSRSIQQPSRPQPQTLSMELDMESSRTVASPLPNPAPLSWPQTLARYREPNHARSIVEIDRMDPTCIRYRPGKVGRCASSCANLQRRPTSSCRNVAHLFPQPDISAWWPGRAWPRNSPFPFIPTCCGTHAGSSSPTTATTLAASRPISGTAVLVENFDLLNLANLFRNL